MNVKMSKDEGIITKRDILQINAILMTGILIFLSIFSNIYTITNQNISKDTNNKDMNNKNTITNINIYDNLSYVIIFYLFSFMLLLVSTTIILFWGSNISIFISKVFSTFSLGVIILTVIKLLSLFFGITIDIIGYALLILVPPFMVLGIGLGIVIRDLINKLKNK